MRGCLRWSISPASNSSRAPGLAVLMSAAKQAKARNGRLAVAALRPVVQEIFAISRFSRVVPVYGTSAEGVAALQ